MNNGEIDIEALDFITRARVERTIKKHSFLAAGLGVVPIPVFNLLSVTVIQINMVQTITRIYNVEEKKSWIKNVIASVLGGLSATDIGCLAMGKLKFFPMIGSSLAAFSSPALNGFSTYAIGYMFARYYQSPDGFLKANAKALTEWFKEGFKEGREKLGNAISGKAEDL
jgi:uncharacterized protein (DUF697 family)